MTIPATPHASPITAAPAATSYRYAHWYFLAALAAIVAGFWPSFFQPLSAGDARHTIHGTTATVWIVVLAVQAGLMAHGFVAWHRRVARFALVLLPVLCVSALQMIALMLVSPNMPPGLAPLLAFIDFPSVAFLVVLVGLALANRRTPPAHKRFMAATVLLAFPPALTRLYARIFAPDLDFFGALHASFFTVELILVALLVADWRARERRAAYPVSLAFFVAVHAVMFPISSTAAWQTFTDWYAALPVFQ
jgi:hypothetical protein